MCAGNSKFLGGNRYSRFSSYVDYSIKSRAPIGSALHDKKTLEKIVHCRAKIPSETLISQALGSEMLTPIKISKTMYLFVKFFYVFVRDIYPSHRCSRNKKWFT